MTVPRGYRGCAVSAVDVHGLPAKWRNEADICDEKASEREDENPRNGQGFRGCANGHRLAADELEAALRQSESNLAEIIEAAERLAYKRGMQEALRQSGEAVAERIAQLTAHRACCGTEHDPANGKLHGYCVVCGVEWPCSFAGTPPATSGLVEALRDAVSQMEMAASCIEAGRYDEALLHCCSMMRPKREALSAYAAAGGR